MHRDGGEVYLRSFEVNDINDRYLEWFKDNDVTRFLNAKNIDYDEALRHFEYGLKTDSFHMFAICTQCDDLHIGNIKIGPIQREHGISELNTIIGERLVWGKGYATQAIRIGAGIAFENMGIRKLSASIDSLNVGSLKAYTAAGFTIEATLKDQFVHCTDGDRRFSDKVYVAWFKESYSPSTATPSSHG